MPSNDYVAGETLYLDKEGGVTKDKQNAVTKLVHAGGKLSAEDAAKYGLTEGGAGDADAAPADDEGEGAIDAQEESARIQGKGSKSSKKSKT